MKTHERIGLLFTVFSGVVFLLHLVTLLSNGEPIRFIFKIENSYFLIVCILSIVSTKCSLLSAKIIQISVSSFCGILAICSAPTEVYNGLLMLVISILLCYNYGFYSIHTKKRIIITCISLYVIFLICPMWEVDNRFTAALAWLSLIVGVCFVVWIIFKDEIEKVKDANKKGDYKYIEVLEEAMSVTEEYRALLKKLHEERQSCTSEEKHD